MTPLRQRMIEDMRIRGFAESTQKIYVDCVAKFARFYGESPANLGREEIRRFQYYLATQTDTSRSHQRQVACALRFLYHTTLRKNWPIGQIPCPRERKKLPTVLSREEVRRFFEAVESVKYRVVFMIAYSAGLRVSEITHLQVHDIDRERMVIHVRRGKGAKERFAILSPSLLGPLDAYMSAARPALWLFPGKDRRRPLTRSAVHYACARITKRAGLKKRVSPHTLRHCFATHLLESGEDLRTIQRLHGHDSLGSTSIYLHLSPDSQRRVVSPLDSLEAQGAEADS